jgi:PASTA domain
MGFVKKGASAFGKLIIVIALAGTFIVGLVGVVYMSLQGQEMKVPEITGKDFVESEKELAGMGLRIKKRADRFSTEKPNTVLEQLPKAGDTVKTGQMILVVTSKTNPEGDEAPTTIKKNVEVDDSEKIEELISDKPKKTNKSNTNTNSNKKKASTTRDVSSENSNSNSNSNADNKNSSDKNTNSGDKSNKNTATNSNKTSSNSNKSNTNVNKPVIPKPPATGGDVRPRKTPQP